MILNIIINNVAEEKNISLTDEDRNLLNNLLDEISQQDYDYDDMKTTLERVEQNVDSTSADLNCGRDSVGRYRRSR